MDIKDLKAQLSIHQVLSHYHLKPDKNNRLLCPFHDDRTPSMQIYPATNTYCCFSANCSAGTGDAIQFIELKEKCSKHEALLKATALLNGNTITVQSTEAKLIIEADVMAKEAVMTKLFKYFTKALPATKKAVDYLQSRALDYKLHEVGYNSGDWHHKLNEAHFIKSCEKYSLLKAKPVNGYSTWAKDCIIFSLKNAANKTVSLYGRSITNNDESRHFYLTNREGLYPHYPSLQTKKLILTESIIDAASLLQQEAIKNNYSILALYGTNGLTDEHTKAIIELPQLEEIILMLNGDEPGEAATTKHYHTLQQLLPEIKVSKAELPAGEDVNSLLQSHDDATILKDLIEQRTPALSADRDFFFSLPDGQAGIETKNEAVQNIAAPVLQSNAKLITSNPELLIYNNCELRIEVLGGIRITGLDRMKVTLKVLHLHKPLLPIRDTLDLYSRVQTEGLIQTISEGFDLNIKKTEITISELTNELEQHRLKKIESLQPKQETKPLMSEAARQTALLELKKANLLQRTAQLIGLSGIVGEENNRLIALLVYTVRKQSVPLHVMFLGSSGSGKTYLQEKISELVPEEDKIEITQITENALYYFKQEELKNKLILIEDLDGALTVFYPLRELQTKRRISKTVTLKDSKGNLKTITLTVEGPVCVSGCTTKEKIYEDNANRCLLLYTDQSKDQDKRINEYQAKLAGGEINREREQQYKELFKNMQRLLRPVAVINPYAKYIQLPEQVFKPRRTMTLLLGFIEAITFYHQYQRTVKKDATGQLYIETTIEDIEAAFTLLKDVLFSKSDELNGATRNFFEQLKRLMKDQSKESFTAKEVRGQLKLNPSNLKRYLIELDRYGLIKATGNRYRKYEYTINSYEEYEALKSSIEGHLQTILQAVRDHTTKQSE